MAALSRFGPPVAVMALIFFLSAQPGLDSGLGAWDVLLRKLAHVSEYALLTLLWARALPRWPPAVPALIALAYAITDELHQTLVPDRRGTPVDVLVDAVGVAVGWLTARRLAARRDG